MGRVNTSHSDSFVYRSLLVIVTSKFQYVGRIEWVFVEEELHPRFIHTCNSLLSSFEQIDAVIIELSAINGFSDAAYNRLLHRANLSVTNCFQMLLIIISIKFILLFHLILHTISADYILTSERGSIPTRRKRSRTYWSTVLQTRYSDAGWRGWSSWGRRGIDLGQYPLHLDVELLYTYPESVRYLAFLLYLDAVQRIFLNTHHSIIVEIGAGKQP